MSRLYPGLYSVLVVYLVDGQPVYDSTEPATYEDCERFVLLVGLGVPYNGYRVTRALIVGPVAGSVA